MILLTKKPEKKQKELAEINKTCCQFRSAAANDWKDFYEAVKAAVESGEIMKTRHASYLEMLEEVALLNKKQW